MRDSATGSVRSSPLVSAGLCSSLHLLHLGSLSSAMSPLLRSPLAGSGVDLCYPLLLNTSCRRTPQPHSTAVVIYILSFSLALLTVLLNLLVIVSISHFRQLHTPTNLVLLSLACADLLIGLLLVPLDAQYFISSCWLLGPWFCTVFHILVYTLTSSSVASVMLVSLDRYVAICQPLHYTSEVTMGRVQLAVGLCWSCSVLYNSSLVSVRVGLQVATCQGNCMLVMDYSSVLVDLLVTVVVPVSVMVVLYLQVFTAALYQTRKMRSSQAGTGTVIRRSELKAALTLGVVVVVFLVCFCPAFTLMVQDISDHNAAWFWSGWLLYSNSCMNPLLYALFYPWFRRTIRLIITLQILKPNSSLTPVLH